MKKLLLALCVCMLLLLLFACKGKETTMDTQAQAQTQTTQQTTVEETTQAPQLSETCDKVLADGYDKENNHYELVANETATSTSSKIEIGVIKNNQWIIPLTEKSPFIGDNGLIIPTNNDPNAGKHGFSIYDEVIQEKSDWGFHYVGNSCFYHYGVFLNSNTKKYFDAGKKGFGTVLAIKENDYSKGIVDYHVCEEGKYLLTYYNDEARDHNELYLLDTNTMKTKQVPVKYRLEDKIQPYSDGLFFIYPYGGHDCAFYNEKGEKAIDMSDYNIDGDCLYCMIFNDEKCTFYTYNDSHVRWCATIDKTGKVLEEYEAQ